MKIFDSHCHLNDRSYTRDMANVIQRAKNAGVIGIMIAGITGKTSQQGIDIAKTYPGCYASVGVHPHDAKSCSEKTLDHLISLSKDSIVRAWGETGLDFNRMYSSKDIQEKCFVRQLEIADKLHLPLIFHERDSKGRFLEILNAHYNTRKLNGIVHCFSGNHKERDAYLDLGLHIGITGILTIKTRGKHLREMVKGIPADRLLVETDAPYLTPAPEKNNTRRNEPAFVRTVLMKLAAVRNDDPEELARSIWQNTCRVFNISDS